MNSKLTLNLDKDIVAQAKTYAKEHNVSLSFLIENYLQRILVEYKSNTVVEGSVVEELSGIINFNDETSLGEDYIDFLAKKYK